MTERSTSSGGIGFFGLLTITFIALKLAGLIDWSWIWVLAPIWISVGLFAGLVAFLILLRIVLPRLPEWKERNRP